MNWHWAEWAFIVLVWLSALVHYLTARVILKRIERLHNKTIAINTETQRMNTETNRLLYEIERTRSII